MRITLRVTAGAFKGQEFTFAGHETFVVGRSKHAHLRLASKDHKDRTLSRVHCMLEVNPPSCRLMDMGSHNGTFVNDQPVNVVELHDGDKIRVGNNILRIAVEQTPTAAPAVASQPTVATIARPPQPAAPPTTATLTEPPRPLPVVTAALIPSPLPLKPVEPSQPPEPGGRTIPGYRLERKLGEGGMGVVYLAVRLADEHLVALKMIRPAVAASPKDVERFLREAKILRELDHPHIVGFRDMGESDGSLWFAMDYVAGPNANQLVRQCGPLAIGRAVSLACQLLAALEFAHAKGFVHRDIKPGNLLVETTNGRETVKLADFGLARVYQSSQLSGLTMSGEIAGTPAFMAPEQLVNFRESPASADQYAAAATLYYLLTGQYVFDVPKQVHLLYGMILNDDPVPIRKRRSDIPAALAKEIHCALAREPGERYASVAELRSALEPFAAAT